LEKHVRDLRTERKLEVFSTQADVSMTHTARLWPGSNDTVFRAVFTCSFKRMETKRKSKVELRRSSWPNTIVLHNTLSILEVPVCFLDSAVKTA